MTIAKDRMRTKIVLDCSIPQKDNILDPSELEAFFHNNIKAGPRLQAKKGVLEKANRLNGEVVRYAIIERQGSNITIDAMTPFKKRYIKFLTKQYLSKHQIRDFLRVVSTGTDSYSLRYFAAAKEALDA